MEVARTWNCLIGVMVFAERTDTIVKTNRNKKPKGCTHPDCFKCPLDDCRYSGGSENIAQYIGVDTKKKNNNNDSDER